MAQATPLEPFPHVSPRQFIVSKESANIQDPTQRRTRGSSLPGEPRGDTGAPAVSSLLSSSSESQVAASPSPPPPSGYASLSKPPRKPWKRRKAKSLFRRWKSISLRHTWLNPLLVVLAVLSYYFTNPGPQNPLHSAIFLSYPLPNSDPANLRTKYGKGGLDFAFVAFYTIVLSFTREFIMQRFIRPLAIRAGVKSRAKLSRFMEQAYTAMYFAIFGPFGLWVMKNCSPVWYFNTSAMYEGFPHREHEGPFKAYYLLQASYWAQQAIVLLLQLEKPRKDFKELVAHHIITLALIWCSYRFHFTYMGLAVYITHDVSDFFLATSKILNYLNSPLTSPYFAFFIGIWAYCRHYLNLRLIWAVLTEFRTVGPFELNWETQQYKCWISQYITLALMTSLQSVNLFWFFLILRIAFNIVFRDKVEDVRSEDGDGDEEVEGSTEEKREKLEKMIANGEAEGVAVPPELQPNGHATPTVLVNGKPLNVPAGHDQDVSATGVRSIEISGTDRRRSPRKKV